VLELQWRGRGSLPFFATAPSAVHTMTNLLEPPFLNAAV
jgi:hypothetical protein